MSSLSIPMSQVLELIKSDRTLRSAILEKDDAIIDDLYKFIGTPNCPSCVAKVQDYVNQNIDFINTLVKNIQKPIPASEKVTPPPKVTETRPVPTPMKVAGEVYEIDADPNQYKELVELSQSQRWIYRGLTVIEKINDDGKKVWMVMFY